MALKELKKTIHDDSVTFEFEVEKDEWQKAQANVLKEYAQKFRKPGFRPGKAPLQEIKKYVNEKEVFSKAANNVINTDIKFFIATTADTSFLGFSPKISIIDINKNKLTFTANFEKMPTVEIADYKKFNIKLDSEEVTDEETQHEFDRMIKKDIMLTNKETGTVENGDSVNIDFTGYIDDKEFAGGSAKGYDLVIGSNSFIPGFESQLIGCTIGETKDIFLTFPKNYHEQYANKEVKFTVKINSISTITKPTFDEFYFKKFKLSDVKTEKDFKEYLKKQLVDWKKHKVFENFQKNISEEIIKTTKISYFPKALLNNEQHKIEHETENLAKKAGVSKEEYLKSLGYTDEKLYKEGLLKTAEKNVKFVCAIEKIASELKIEVTQKDFNDYFEKVSRLYGMSIDDVKKQYHRNLTNIEAFIFQKKIFSELQKFYK